MSRPTLILLSTLALGACASRPAVVAVAPPPPVVAPVAPPLPRGAFPGMAIPARLADGSYPTPNRALTPAATLWHLRAALNVAALACRGPQEAVIVAGYNAMLGNRKPVLTRAEATYAAEYRAQGGDWQDRYDDAMTRLYNFFSQSPARDAFCDAAVSVLGEVGGVPADELATFAVARLPVLEAPFTDFYRAYDAWRANAVQPLVPRAPVYALNAPIVSTTARIPGVVAEVTPSAPRPRLTLDPSVFQ